MAQWQWSGSRTWTVVTSRGHPQGRAAASPRMDTRNRRVPTMSELPHGMYPLLWNESTQPPFWRKQPSLAMLGFHSRSPGALFRSGGGCKSWIGGVNPGVLFRASDCSFVAAIVEHRDSPLRKSSALDSHQTVRGNEGGECNPPWSCRPGASDGRVPGPTQDDLCKLPATCRLPLV